MSCDRDRDNYWKTFEHIYVDHVPRDVRDVISEVGHDLIQDAVEDSLEKSFSQGGTRRKKPRKKGRTKSKTKPLVKALENTYQEGKKEGLERKGKWSKGERQELNYKTRRLLRWIRQKGELTGRGPGHGATDLPRISSQKGYSAVHDKLESLGVDFSSPYDAAYHEVERQSHLNLTEKYELVQQVEKAESQYTSGGGGSARTSQMKAIRKTAPKVFEAMETAVTEPSINLEESTDQVEPGANGDEPPQERPSTEMKMMKFLVLAKPREGAPPLEDPMAALQASHGYIDDMIAKGAFDCYYQFAAGDQSVCIVNARSAEEMWENLSACPLSDVREYEIHPLADVHYVIDKRLEKMA